MARIPDAERIKRLLESEEGTLGRREIIETLGLSDERYEAVAFELCEEEVAVKNRGRAGGLRLIASPTSPRTRSIRAAEREPEPALERDLYPPFKRYLLGAAETEDESRSVVLATHGMRAGKWETPDLVEVRVTPFVMIGQWELRVVTYELKRAGAWTVESVLQAASYNEFAHESWLVVPSGGTDEDWTSYFGPRVVARAGSFGVGLATFDARRGTLWKHTTPRMHLPPLARQHQWLESAIDGVGDERTKTGLAANIRWARSKADAGRD